MSLVPTELFSFERKRQSYEIRYKIDYMCELLGDYLETLINAEIHLLTVEVTHNDIKISFQVPDDEPYYSFISFGNALMYMRAVIKRSRRIDLREKYTENLLASELGL